MSEIARRVLVLTLAWFAACTGVGAFAEPRSGSPPRNWWLYVGTYSQRGSKGIYRFDMDSATGKLSNRAVAAESADPSFLAIHPNRRMLFAVNEISNFEGGKTGAVSSFAIDPRTGGLTLLSQQSSGGAAPCHLTIDPKGKHVLAANYGGGSVCVLPIAADGRLGKPCAFVQHSGHGADPSRQEAAHAHSVNLDPAGRHAFVADLGLDKIMIYRFDPDAGTLAANDPPVATASPASGPRHFAFHPGGRWAYAINELANTIDVFRYDAGRGALSGIQTVPTLPPGFTGKSGTAEVVVHPSGRFVYGSNRGHDSIAVFAVDQQTGRLRSLGTHGEGIKTPRNFVLDPTGKWLFVANQDSDRIVVFHVDGRTGALTPTGHTAEVPMPVCLRMMPAG